MNWIISMDATEIGFLIRQERKNQNLTQEQLAALAGVGVRFIREVEHGKPTCQLALVLQVMQTLGLKLGIKTPDHRWHERLQERFP
jgi:y4mF family transcriptional regulator